MRHSQAGAASSLPWSSRWGPHTQPMKGECKNRPLGPVLALLALVQLHWFLRLLLGHIEKRQPRVLARAAPRADGAGKMLFLLSDICASPTIEALRASTSQLAAAPCSCYRCKPAFLTKVAAWFSGQTSDHLGPPQPLRGPQPSASTALEDSKLCGDISPQAANSCELETMEQRITGKEQSAITHPALSWIPFGFIKISDVLRSWVHQTSPAFAQSRAQRCRTLLANCSQHFSHLPLADMINFTTLGPKPCVWKSCCRHPVPHPPPTPLVPGALVGSGDPPLQASCSQGVMTCVCLSVQRKSEKAGFYYSP